MRKPRKDVPSGLIAQRTIFPDQIVSPPLPNHGRDQLVTERQSWMHRDTDVVPFQLRDQLSEDVRALTNVDPYGVGLEDVDAGLVRRVQKDGCPTKRVAGRIPPPHGHTSLLTDGMAGSPESRDRRFLSIRSL